MALRQWTALVALVVVACRERATVQSFAPSPVIDRSCIVPNAPCFTRPQRPHLDSRSSNHRKSNHFSRSSSSLKSSAIVGAATTAAVAGITASSTVSLPPLQIVALSCLLPTLLGYYKSEYGVSYGYGTATATVAALVLRSLATATSYSLLESPLAFLSSSVAACHAGAVLFYGTRLDAFLLYRELFLPRFRAMRERIEERAKKRGGRLSRTPFLLSCAMLYACMTAPLLVTTQLVSNVSTTWTAGGWLERALRISVYASWGGFLLGALGDVTKSVCKALRGDDALVTGGVFRFFRHPNYTGEVIGWTSSCIAGFIATAIKATGGATWKAMAPYLAASIFGTLGITFVLGTATVSLEHRQKEKYGDLDEYKDWVKKSWVGFRVGNAPRKPATEEPKGDISEEETE